MSGGQGYSNNQNNQRGYNNGFNNNNNCQTNLPKEALPPMTHESKPDKQNRIKIEWMQGRAANWKGESEKVAVYDDTAKEGNLQNLTEYREILIDYPYLQKDNEATTAYRIFKRCLKGSAKNSWSRAVAGVNGGLIDTNNRLNKVVTQTTEAILGTNTYDNQVKYLNTTKKPRKLSVDEWMQRIQNINLHLVNMEDGARIY